MRSYYLRTVGLFVSRGGSASGCGSNTGAPTTPGQPVIAGGNSRIKFKKNISR